MYCIGEHLFLITQTLGYFRVKSSVPLILDTRFECGIESNNFNCRHNTDVLKQISCIAFFSLDILYRSPAGAILFHMLHALLLLPMEKVSPIMHELMSMLSTLDQISRILPEVEAIEAIELENRKG